MFPEQLRGQFLVGGIEDGNEPPMRVVEHRSNDSYDAMLLPRRAGGLDRHGTGHHAARNSTTIPTSPRHPTHSDATVPLRK
jgi:hypothetical protein